MMLKDNRLRAVFDLLPVCGTVADIGTDHGKLGCALLKAEKCRTVWFSDISVPSLEKAKLLAEKLGLAERAVFCAGDGCEALPGSPDAAVIAGMGGATIVHILTEGREKLKNSCLVLGAQSELPDVRSFLMNNGFRLEDETVAQEAGRLYVLMKAVPGQELLTPAQLKAGPRLMQKRDANTAAYFEAMAKKAGFALACAVKAGREDTAELAGEVKIWQSLR